MHGCPAGQLGDATVDRADSNAPKWVITPPGAPVFTHVAAGLNHACAIRANGSAACW